MSFQPRHTCVKCLMVLTDHERRNSGGVCPHCGHISKGTICDTEKSAQEIPAFTVIQEEESRATFYGKLFAHTLIYVFALLGAWFVGSKIAMYFKS